MLREQLDQATAANQSLTTDIHKLTIDLQRSRQELKAKEIEWGEEEQVGIDSVMFCRASSIQIKVKAICLKNSYATLIIIM